jgi:hypothetical protein
MRLPAFAVKLLKLIPAYGHGCGLKKIVTSPIYERNL